MKIRFALAQCAAALTVAAFAGTAAHAQTPPKKYKVYLSMSYSGNGYQTETSNLIKALAATPPYDKLVELKTVISGTDVQAQAAAYQSMVSAGADAIITFPISSTGLNRAIHEACEKHVLVYTYSGTVTEPCARTVSYITAGFAQNTAQWLVNKLDGNGNVFIDRGVAGNSVDKMNYDGAMSVFRKYPNIKVVAEYYGMWNSQTTQQETAKALAAHPDVDAIFGENGEDGIVAALLASGQKKLVPVTGENTNGFRLALANPDLRKRGLDGISSGDPINVSGYAFKLMMEELTGKRKVTVHNIEYPLPWVPADKVKVCTRDSFVNGCNAFPSTKVPDSFNTEVFDPVLTPELSLNSALHGTPTPGATIQPLPANVVREAPNVPGVNCQHCQAPADLFKLTKVSATVKP
ncbi:sugar ABC transporter substrate-binding protein [Paraburkholderia sp. SARCC-3016]|uniref:sugar ABC transporter substrate-binding protein n=1 Tax=Paraburkholderia sp. SARCC-3016 TaxID=3058611 RepID=UPI0028081416|nr:sugar ABC transporter substrate-binding protein [Paraburkholderia sp. SARCC-3016]MDQ7981079.1 sugar ABC transporter substrate-binding protein [Paraburkholderia sp. SARCC-3016]